MSTSVHIQNDISDFVRDSIRKILPDGGTIFDPTCGKINRQFKKYFTGTCTYDEKYHYIGKDIIFGFDVFTNKSKEPIADLVWYDPPFTPKPTIDKRASDYGTQGITVEEIKNFFSIPVIINLSTYTKKYLAVRGMDFYYPINSLNYYSFHEMCITPILQKTPLNLYCLFIMPYIRHDLDYLVKINKRPVINYSYTVVFMKGNFAVY